MARLLAQVASAGKRLRVLLLVLLGGRKAGGAPLLCLRRGRGWRCWAGSKLVVCLDLALVVGVRGVGPVVAGHCSASRGA
jgi:hypothetical protein